MRLVGLQLGCSHLVGAAGRGCTQQPGGGGLQPAPATGGGGLQPAPLQGAAGCNRPRNRGRRVAADRGGTARRAGGPGVLHGPRRDPSLLLVPLHVPCTSPPARGRRPRFHSQGPGRASRQLPALQHGLPSRIASSRVASLQVASFRVVSFRVVSFRVASFRVVSFRVASFRVVSESHLSVSFLAESHLSVSFLSGSYLARAVSFFSSCFFSSRNSSYRSSPGGRRQPGPPEPVLRLSENLGPPHTPT